MKKSLELLILLVLCGGIVIGVVGCSGTNINPPEEVPEVTPGPCEMLDINTLPLEIKHLLREYLYLNPYYKESHSISRWPCGIIYVYDETKYSRIQELLNLANQLIAGPTVFRLTEKPEKAKIKIIFQEGDYLGEEKADEITGELLEATVYISTVEESEVYNTYFFGIMKMIFFATSVFRNPAEIEYLKSGAIPENYKKVIYYGYRLPIGTEIDPNW